MKWIMALTFPLSLLHPLLTIFWWAALGIWANGKEKAPTHCNAPRR